MKADPAVIEEQAKHIMESFLKELGSITQEEHFGLEREEEMRTPKEKQASHAFREAFIANAPKTKDGYLVAEKKQW